MSDLTIQDRRSAIIDRVLFRATLQLFHGFRRLVVFDRGDDVVVEI